MYKRPFLTSFTVIAFLTMACHTATEKSWELRLPEEGRDFVMMDITNLKDTITTGFHLQQVSVKDSLLSCRVLFTVLNRAERNGPMFWLAGKSPADMEKMLLQIKLFNDSCRKAVAADSIHVVYTRKGQVVAVKGVDVVVSKIATAFHRDPRDVYSSLRDMFNTTSMQDLFARLLFYLPGKPVKVGDSWVNNYTLVNKAPVKYSNLITVQALKGDSVILNIQTAVTARTGESGKVFAEGSQWGTVTASLATGLPYHVSLQDTVLMKTDTYGAKSSHQLLVHMQ